MENASKALLIAGGILIAIIILALLVRSSSTISSFQKQRLTEEEQAQLEAFNERYTKYVGQYVYGTEVLSLMNKERDDNLVHVILTEGSEQPSINDNQSKYNDATHSYSSETKYYKCIGVTFNSTTGRVNTITFQQIKLGSGV